MRLVSPQAQEPPQLQEPPPDSDPPDPKLETLKAKSEGRECTSRPACKLQEQHRAAHALEQVSDVHHVKLLLGT